MGKVFQIRIGKHQTGIIGLEEALKEMSEEKQILSDQNIGTRMVEKLSEKNYIPSTVIDVYESAFLREYKKFIGEPVPKIPVDGIEIKAVGSVPSRARLKAFIQEAQVQLNEQL